MVFKMVLAVILDRGLACGIMQKGAKVFFLLSHICFRSHQNSGWVQESAAIIGVLVVYNTGCSRKELHP